MISKLSFKNLSANTNTVLRLLVEQCVRTRCPHCTFSIMALSDKTKLSKDRVKASVKLLNELGYISSFRIPGGGYRYFLDGKSITVYTKEINKYSGSTRF